MLAVVAIRLRVFGQHHVRRTGGVLLVANHQSYLDPVVLGLGLDRMIAFMARRTLFQNAWFAKLIRLLNAFPVTRGGRDTAAMHEAVDRLRAGECLVMFAEGTRTRDGRIGPLRAGILVIAQRAGVPMVPTAIDGAYDIWPRHGGLQPGHVAVSFGMPIWPEEQAGMGRDVLVRRLAEALKTQQAGLRRMRLRERLGAGT